MDELQQEPMSEEMLEEMRDLQEEEGFESNEDDMLDRGPFQEALGAPEAEQRFNQHVFLSQSIQSDEPEKVTFLSESELGRPLFNLRFLLDIEDICKYYLDDLAKEYKTDNKISQYFREKINNISSSGMSNKGFLQNLNASKKIDVTRSRIRNLEPLKGGKTK